MGDLTNIRDLCLGMFNKINIGIRSNIIREGCKIRTRRCDMARSTIILQDARSLAAAM